MFASLIFVLLILITAKDQICEHRPKCVFSCTRALRTQVAPKVKVYTRYNVAQAFRTEALKVSILAPPSEKMPDFFCIFFCFAIFSTLLKPGISTALTDDALACAACYARRRRLHTKQLGIRGKGSCTTSGIWWGSITERRQCLSRRQRLSPQFSRLPQQVSGAARKLQRACPKI